MCQCLKLIFYKDNAKLPIVTKKLHDSAPYFRPTRTKILGRIVQFFWTKVQGPSFSTWARGCGLKVQKSVHIVYECPLKSTNGFAELLNKRFYRIIEMMTIYECMLYHNFSHNGLFLTFIAICTGRVIWI